MTDNSNVEPADDTDPENLDWDSDTLGPMADYADNTEPELEN